MQKREINPFLKMVLEFGPIVAFFVAYMRLKDRVFTLGGTEYEGFILVTAGFIPLMIISTGLLWKLTGKISKMQVLTLVLIIVFGGLSVWFNDDRFFKMKPTMIYLIFAGILGFGLMRGQSYLRHVMEEMMPLEQEGWMILTRRLTLFFLCLAVLNELIWRTQSTDAWVLFKTFGLLIATFGFFMTQNSLFRTYGLDEKSDSSDS